MLYTEIQSSVYALGLLGSGQHLRVLFGLGGQWILSSSFWGVGSPFQGSGRVRWPVDLVFFFVFQLWAVGSVSVLCGEFTQLTEDTTAIHTRFLCARRPVKKTESRDATTSFIAIYHATAVAMAMYEYPVVMCRRSFK